MQEFLPEMIRRVRKEEEGGEGGLKQEEPVQKEQELQIVFHYLHQGLPLFSWMYGHCVPHKITHAGRVRCINCLWHTH